MTATKKRVLLLLLLALFCASGVFDHALWTPNDSREGGMVADLYRTGHWTVLSLNGEPFLEKPPLLHWAALVFCTLAGHVSAGLVRLPAALFGFLTALLVWAWGLRLGRERAGILAAFLCATNITYYEYSRIVLTDICLTFGVALSLHLFWSAYAAPKPRAWRYAIFLCAASASFYAKGLIGPVFVMASVVIFLATQKRWKLASGLSFAFAPMLVAAVAPWAIQVYREGGGEYLIRVFVDNQLGRFFRLPTGAAITSLPVVGPYLGFMADRPVPNDPYFVHKEAMYHYLIKLPTRLLPWTLLVLPAVFHWVRGKGKARAPFAIFLSIAAATILAILHLASSKVGIYALPAFPMLFLMIGVWCEDKSGTRLSRFEALMVSLTTGLVTVLVVALPSLYLLLFALPGAAYDRIETILGRLDQHVALGDPSTLVWCVGARTAWAGAAACVAALALAVFSLRIVRARMAEMDYVDGLLGLPVTIAIVGILAGSAAMPAYDRQRSYEPMAALARRELAQGRRIALASPEQQIVGEFVFYTGQPLPVIEPIPGTREFLLRDEGPNGVVVRRAQLDAIESSLAGVDHTVERLPEDAGYNAREFCLIARH